MKSITVTTHRSYNYGGVLQAYALQQYQKKRGIENYLLQLPVFRKIYATIKGKALKPTLISIYSNINAFVFRKELLTVRKKFDSFVEDKLETTLLYSTKDDLYINPPIADFYLSGSDQVFSVRNTQTYARLLQWVPDNKPCYSYAASLGEYDWSDEEEKYIASILKTFKGISVRETYANNLLSNIIEQDIYTHLDPVFLLDKEDYDEIAIKPDIAEPYILVYPLIRNPNMQSLINQAKDTFHCKTVSVRTSRNVEYRCDKYVYDAGPQEFLGLIQNASAIITSSFHGVALACLFNIPFYVTIKDYKSQRITDLLSRFQLMDRIYDGKENKQLSFDVDFSKTNDEIGKGRNDVDKYFDMIISEVKTNE